MKNGRRFAQELLNGVDYPGEILTGVPVIELKGSSEAVVICHRGVVAYDPNTIRISTSIGAVDVRGENLTIHRMNRERIVLHGSIRSVEMGAAL